MIGRRAGAVLVAALLGVVPAACSRDDSYSRDTYPDGRTIDSGLADAMRDTAEMLAKGEEFEILMLRTAPPWFGRMKRFLHTYAGTPTTVLAMRDAGDATATESLLVTCPGGDRQRVGLAWAWFDGDWRAWPEYNFPLGRCGSR